MNNIVSHNTGHQHKHGRQLGTEAQKKDDNLNNTGRTDSCSCVNSQS